MQAHSQPKNYAVPQREVQYLGYHLGVKQLRPHLERTTPITSCPHPKTKKEVRRFLGSTGYYQ